MKKWIWTLSILLVLCIVMGNLYLYQTNRDKVYHVTKITSFDKPTEGDMRISYLKKGVVTSSEEKVITYQQQLGVLDEILVSEGDQVQVGTPLVQYSIEDLNVLKLQLESKIDRSEAESSKLRSDISALRAVTFPTVFESEWEEAQSEANETLIDSQIRELELQEELLEMDIEDYELELEALANLEASRTTTSTSPGIVTSVNENGHDELLTIVTYPYVIEGELSESDLTEIEVGQKVYIPNGEKPLVGTINEISAFPVKAPSLHEETSYFPFSITVAEEEGALLYGHHMEVDIVKTESLDTLILPSQAVKGTKDQTDIVFILERGKVKKIEVEKGIENEGKVEIVTGLTGQELVVTSPKKNIKADLPFTMSMKKLYVGASELKSVEKKEWTTTILRAVISN
ncbi:efflux RND transporter periplasmic adaptor subunit [Bacillus sp. AK128]